MFDKMKAIMDMQKNMQELKRQLGETDFEVASSDGLVKIVMSGLQEVKEVIIQANYRETEKNALEQGIKDAYNKAIKHAQSIAAGKMKGISGLNLPGLF